ncbi:MAG: hypothetical protein KDD03_04000, partial [Gelidibacter sp.]|nr:hypothetical protein [Gelidibacter sp.]
MDTQHSKEASDRKEYNKKVLSVVPHMHPYVKHRLYIAESIGVLPKNMYSSSGIIDDCIITMYEKGYNCDADAQSIKLKLFETIDNHLEDLFVKEAYHTKTISTNSFLQEELRRLEESYTIDADLDYMMLEQLDDISYHQHDDDHHDVFVFDDNNTQVLDTLDLSLNAKQNNRKLVG